MVYVCISQAMIRKAEPPDASLIHLFIDSWIHLFYSCIGVEEFIMGFSLMQLWGMISRYYEALVVVSDVKA